MKTNYIIIYNNIIKMQLFIRTYTNKTITIECNNISSIMEIKEIITSKIIIPSKYYYLTSKGKILHNNNLLSHYDITNNMTLYMHIRHTL